MNKDGIGLSQYVALLALVIISTIYIYPNISRNNITNESAIITFEETPAEIIRGDISKKQVIFTFDGGGGSQSAKAILDTLKKHNVKSTFFLTGKFIEDNQEIVKRMISEKHEIFNHTYDHPYLTQLPEGRIAQELQMMDSEYQKISGVSTKPYFRAPYGDRDSHVLDVAAKAGYRSVFWTVDASDWEEPTGMTANQVRDKILSNINPGEIFLMHLGDNITGKILDDVFTEIEARGYKIVSLTQGML